MSAVIALCSLGLLEPISRGSVGNDGLRRRHTLLLTSRPLGHVVLWPVRASTSADFSPSNSLRPGLIQHLTLNHIPGKPLYLSHTSLPHTESHPSSYTQLLESTVNSSSAVLGYPDQVGARESLREGRGEYRRVVTISGLPLRIKGASGAQRIKGSQQAIKGIAPVSNQSGFNFYCHAKRAGLWKSVIRRIPSGVNEDSIQHRQQP